mgnify:CR=1 FL=1
MRDNNRSNKKNVKTNIMVDEDIWKKVKHLCIDKNISVSQYVMSLIKKDLKIN